MRLTSQKQLNILAERTYDLKQNLSEKDKQRRNQVVDLYGVDISRDSNSRNEAVMYVSVSFDLIYYMRFQFKVYIETDSATQFQILVRSKVYNEDTEKYQLKNIDITPYLIAQQDGEWIDGERKDSAGYTLAWPSNGLPEDEDSDSPPNAYDVLEVIDMMRAEGKEYEAQALERAEYKPFIIKANAPFFAAMSLYLKYSHVGR